jgi:hypothetical protein
MQIPYFGTVRIARSGVLSKELHVPVIDTLDSKKSPVDGLHAPGYIDFTENDDSRTMAGAGYSSVDSVPAQSTSQHTSIISDDLLQQYQGPGLTAGMDDWAFQGVDMALFDNLMKGVNDYDVE